MLKTPFAHRTMVSTSDLLHYKLQAALRENEFPDDELAYLGYRRVGDTDEFQHHYLIAGEHIVPVNMIEDFENTSDHSE